MASGVPIVVHMIGNAHLDPLWLWEWQRGSDEGPQVIRLSIAAGETCLDGLLDSLQRPPIVWDDFLGVSRTHRLEPN